MAGEIEASVLSLRMKLLSTILLAYAVFASARVVRRQSGGCECAGELHAGPERLVHGLTHTIGRTYTSSDIFNAIDEAEDGGAR